MVTSSKISIFSIWSVANGKNFSFRTFPEYEKKHTEDLPVFTVLVHGPVLLVCMECRMSLMTNIL